MTVKESSTSYNIKEKHSNNKEAYTDGSKSTRRKVGFAVVFQTSLEVGHYPRSLPPYS